MSGYWKTITIFNEETGRKQNIQVWVDTTKNKQAQRQHARRRAAAYEGTVVRARAQRLAERNRRRALAAAQAAADAAAAAVRIARQRAKADARRRAFEAVQRRQAEILRRRGIIRDRKRSTATKAEDYISERERMQDEMRERRVIQQQAQQRAAAAASAEQTRLDEAEWRRQQRKKWLLFRINGDAPGVHGGTPEPLSQKEARDLELILKDEADRSSQGRFDTESLETFREAYNRYAERVYKEYEQLVAQIHAAIDDGKIERARELYGEYTKLVPEFQRLFGSGANPLKDGAFNAFERDYQRIGQAQRDWWKAQLREQLERSVTEAGGRTSPAVDGAKELLGLLNGTIKTSQITDPVTGKTRYLTLEEELAKREAQRIAEQERLRAIQMRQSAMAKRQMMIEGFVEYKGQWVDRAQVPVIQDAESVMRQFYNGEFKPTDPHEIHVFVDHMMSEWDKRHPKPYTGRVGGPNGVQMVAANDAWAAARRAYEDSAYKFFGLGPQGILEKGVATPGISHALQLLQAPFSVLGAGGRVANAAIFGESTIGGSVPNFNDAPPSVKIAAQQYASDAIRQAGQAMAARGITGSRWAPDLNALQQQYFQKWLTTPEGQKWLQSTVAERHQQELQENTDFAAQWGQGDVWKQLEALNQFGSQPFQNEGANLLSSLILDPLNVIPLKFTTYFARGKYALEATQGASRLGRAPKFIKTFTLTDEGTLRAWKSFSGVEAELAAKGISRDRFLDTLRERVQGIGDAAKRNEAARDLFRELGLDPRKVNETQLYNLTEQLIHAKIKNEKLDFFSQADELAEKLSAAEKATKQADEARAAATKAEQRRVAESLRVREERARAARSAEGAAKRAEEASLKKAAADRARQAGAAKKVAGPSSPAKPSVFSPARLRLRQSYEKAISDVRLGKPALDPESGKELNFLSQNHAIVYYQKQIDALDAEVSPVSRTGAEGSIEAKMAAGDVAGSQADNITEGVVRGGTLESGGALRPNARPPEATPAPALLTGPAPLHEGDVLLQKLGDMSEADWYAHVKAKMGAILTSKKATRAQKAEARARLARVKQAELAMQAEKRGGSYVGWKDRANFQRRVLRRFGSDAEKFVAPRLVAPFVQSARDLVVEQARTYYKLLSSAAPVDLAGVVGIKIKGKTVDFMPMDVFRELDRRISAAISEARGYTADTVTRARGSRLTPDEEVMDALGRMSDRDPLVLSAKRKALKQYAADTGNVVSMVAYDEARKVLWKGYVQGRTAQRLLRLAQKRVAESGGDLEKVYLELRDELARREARKQLGGMAFRTHYGVDPSVIFAEFAARYGDDGTIRHFQPELTGFQRRTLEANFAALAGRAPSDANVAEFLQSANRPPLHSRELTREFQKRIGAWSPRLSEQFVQGAKSWSVADEARYWLDNFGEVPPWADVNVLSDIENGAGVIFHDQAKYFEQMKAWGIFNRSHDLELRVEGKTPRQIEEARLKGDPELDLPARRSLELQRRYVIERYGSLVSKDGETLDAMPWLMHEDEVRRYMARESVKSMPKGFIQTGKELDEVVGLISRGIDRFWDQYIGVKAADGPILQSDVFRLASEIQAQLLANPKWARRYRDVFGKTLNAWAALNRWLVFSNPSFMVVNLVDAPIKGFWYRMSRRGLFNRALEGSPLAKKADELTPQMFNWDATPAMYREKQLRARERIVKPRGLTEVDRIVDRVVAVPALTGEIFPEITGRAELAMRMRLAKGMYPEVYSMALKRLGDEEIAHLAALEFIKKEVTKMWPTAGTGPLEQLWNRFVPFASYTVRNKVLWISEAISHPVVLVHFERIGRAIEAHNLAEWEREHPGQEMPKQLRRLIKLPWAPDYYIDLSQFTDASRGLKPLYDTRWKSTQDRFAEWVRIVNPSMQAGIYALFNAFNLFPRTAWQIGEDGQYRLATVPWAEPWSQDAAELGSMLWFVDAVQTGQKYGIDGWNSGEASAMIGQVFFFNAITTYNKMGVRYGWYKGLSKEDRATFLRTPEGHEMMEWLAELHPTSDFKGDLLAMMAQHDADPGKWWFVHQPDEWKARVSEARDKITKIRQLFADELFLLTPGTTEYRELKGRMYLAISDVYAQYPELMQADVYSKTAAEWAAQTSEWQTDKLTDDFMALSRQRPQRSDYSSTVAYNNAVADWERQKQIFLNTYPQVAKRLAGGIVEVNAVRDQINKLWDETLTRIGKRNESIDAAKAILEKYGRDSTRGQQAQERLDLLYIQNDLDYTLLERDYAAAYFGPDDYTRLPDGTQGPLKDPDLLKRITLFNDFDRAVYEKHLREGTLDEYLAKAAYGRGVKAAILYAKHGDPFGKFDPARYYKYTQEHPFMMDKYFSGNTASRDAFGNSARYVEGIRAIWKEAGDDPAAFVRLLKQDKWLMREYFKRNPGKEAEWARNDQYIRLISRWGRLVGAGRWDEANDVWDSLPKWVQDEYHSRHPERRGRAQQTAQYMGYMKKWIRLFESSGDEKAMDYFRSLPKWARDRYYAAHPDNRLKFETTDRMSRQLREYFAADSAGQADYLASHPELRRWLAKNSGSKEQRRLAILQAYQTIPADEAWLRRVFREKYPEVFSQEALGEQRLRVVYETLARHPGVLPEFEKWVKTIWKTYEQMLRLGTPRPVKLYFERDREAEEKARERLKSRSAAQTSA